MTLDDYCRELEAHLCRRNGGHLVRVVGPGFDIVREWGRLGIPLKVAMQGIDRHIDRVEARGGHRRPVRIEFCDADVRGLFEQWRRAVGLRVAASDMGEGERDVPSTVRRPSLAGHIERVIARLTALRGGAAQPEWERALASAVGELDALHATARKARGEARAAIVDALGAIDERLIGVARQVVSEDVAEQASAEAIRELEPFRERLRAAAWDDAVQRGRDVVLRERLGLPTIVIE